MIRTPRWAFALALLPIAACSSNPPLETSAPPAPPAIAAADQAFVNTAASTDATEIQTSQIAEKKAPSPRVKRFASKMITDHQKTTQQLAQIAQAKSIPVMPTPTDPAMLEKLNSAKGAAFDRDYMHGQLEGHEAAVKAFQDEIANGTDPDLKAFAQATLPTLQQHLTMAKQLTGGSAPRAPRHRAST